MTSADLLEKFRRFPVPIISGAIILACFFAYYFRSELLVDLQAEQNEVLNRRDQVDLNLVAGSSLAEHMEEMRAKLAELKKRVVQPSELADNLNYFYQIDAKTGVAAIDLKQNAPSEKPVPQNQLGGIGYTVALSGTFPQVIGYFNEFENGARFYRLRNFRLERGREASQANVALTLNLELLGWKQ